MTSQTPVREHRPDIQGLRALAVTAVVLYHLWPGLVPGGYVGVDVFFVISGFLITGLLVRELEATGRVDLLAFYAGRIRRLLPAALLVLGTSLVVLVLFMPPVVWRSNIKEIGAAAFYAQNWALAIQQVDYFAGPHAPTLVQHFWSLSLEEQFYLVWPIVLVVAVAAGALGRLGTVRRRVAVVVSAVGLFSLVVCMSAPAQPDVAFFSTRARAWEFALGGLVALLPALALRPHVRRMLVATGVVALLGSFLALSNASAFPGWLTVIPTVGAALVIAVASRARGRGGLFGWAPVQWVGDHSYSIYLWHWPPLVALPWIVHGELGNGVRVGILGATLVLAWMTKALVEDPFRADWQRRAARWPSFGLAAAGMCLVLASTTTVGATVGELERHASTTAATRITSNERCVGAPASVDPGCRRPYARPGDAKLAFAKDDSDPEIRGCQLGITTPAEPLWCEWSAHDDPTRTIAVVGNSFAGQIVTILNQWVGNRPIRILLTARTGCLGLSVTAVTGQSEDDPCPVWSAKVQSRLLAMDDLSAVIFSDHADAATFMTGRTHPGDLALTQASAAITTSLETFHRAGIATAVLQAPPGNPSQSAPECIAMATETYDPCAIPRASVVARSLLLRVASANPHLTRVIHMNRYFCDRLLCHATVGGIVVYKDDQHLTASFARTLARPLSPAFDALLGGFNGRRPPHGW